MHSRVTADVECRHFSKRLQAILQRVFAVNQWRRGTGTPVRCDKTALRAATQRFRDGSNVAQVKILTTSLQMLSLFANDDSYPVSTPPAYSKYVADVSGWANVDFYSFFKSVCASPACWLALGVVSSRLNPGSKPTSTHCSLATVN